MVVEWSELFRTVTYVWLGAVRRSVQVRLFSSGCQSMKMFGIIIVVVIIIFIIIIIILNACQMETHQSSPPAISFILKWSSGLSS